MTGSEELKRTIEGYARGAEAQAETNSILTRELVTLRLENSRLEAVAKERDRQHWLYTFAGQIAQGLVASGRREMADACGDTPPVEWIVDQARALLAALEGEE